MQGRSGTATKRESFRRRNRLPIILAAIALIWIVYQAHFMSSRRLHKIENAIANVYHAARDDSFQQANFDTATTDSTPKLRKRKSSKRPTQDSTPASDDSPDADAVPIESFLPFPIRPKEASPYDQKEETVAPVDLDNTHFTVVIPIRHMPLPVATLSTILVHPAVKQVILVAAYSVHDQVLAAYNSSMFRQGVSAPHAAAKLKLFLNSWRQTTASEAEFEEGLPNFSELIHSSTKHIPADRRSNHFLLSLSQSLVPSGPDFITVLTTDINHLYENNVTEGRDAVVGCRHVRFDDRRNSHVIIEHGVDILASTNLEASPASIYMARRLNGFPLTDARVQRPISATATSFYCLATPLRLYKSIGGFSVKDQPNTWTTIASGILDRRVTQSLLADLPRVVFELEGLVGYLTTEQISNSKSPKLLEAVRTVYDVVTNSILVWEKHGAKTFADIDRSDFKRPPKPEGEEALTVAVIAHLEKARRMISRLRGRKVTPAADEEEAGLDFCLQASHGFKAPVFVSTATVVLDEGLLPVQFSRYAEDFGHDGLVDVVAGAAYPLHNTRTARRWTHHLKRKMLREGEEIIHDTSDASLSEIDEETEGPAVIPLHILWNHYCCHCCGFSTEIVHFVWPLLRRHMNVSLMTKQECFCQGAPNSVSSALNRSYYSMQRYIQADVTRKAITVRNIGGQLPANHPVTIWVEHNDPASLLQDTLRQHRPEYLISRSMYEFTLLDTLWVSSANEYADEVWVPAETVKKNFITSGVKPSLITIIPEAVDTFFFDPVTQPKMQLPNPQWRTWCNKPPPKGTTTEKEYRFLADFKWEPRKGWDILFKAYNQAFGEMRAKPTASPPDEEEDETLNPATKRNRRAKPTVAVDVDGDDSDVTEKPQRKKLKSKRVRDEDTNAEAERELQALHSEGKKGHHTKPNTVLYILTHIWYSGVRQGDPHNVTYLQEEIARDVLGPLGMESFDQLPRFCFLLSSVKEDELPPLYNAMDAFVLPTKGEGWGLPSIQAMAMALPTISTNFGGQMEYMKPWNSFLIPVESVEEIPRDSVYRWRQGKKWGVGSLTETARLMRLVYDQQEYAKRVGQVARRHIVEQFSEQAVELIVRKRLLEVKQIVLNRRREKH